MIETQLLGLLYYIKKITRVVKKMSGDDRVTTISELRHGLKNVNCIFIVIETGVWFDSSAIIIIRRDLSSFWYLLLRNKATNERREFGKKMQGRWSYRKHYVLHLERRGASDPHRRYYQADEGVSFCCFVFLNIWERFFCCVCVCACVTLQ